MKVASLANLVALLAMNASFCEIDARSVQVIKALHIWPCLHERDLNPLSPTQPC